MESFCSIVWWFDSGERTRRVVGNWRVGALARCVTLGWGYGMCLSCAGWIRYEDSFEVLLRLVPIVLPVVEKNQTRVKVRARAL